MNLRGCWRAREKGGDGVWALANLRWQLQALVCATVVGLVPARALAQDNFEIQVYDSETAGPWRVGLETHLIYDVSGTTAASPDGQAPTEHQFHVTFEPHIGIGTWVELGMYLQTALLPDSGFEYAGVKLRCKLRLDEKLGGHVGLAINFEISNVPRQFEPNVWGSEIRPIIDGRWGILYASLNPIVDIDLNGPDSGLPQFQPAAKIAFDVIHSLALGLEYYGAFGPITHTLPLSESTNRLFAALDFTSDYFDLNVGIGYGLSGPEKWIVKAILGFHGKTDH
jgi:hypothetical protein